MYANLYKTISVQITHIYVHDLYRRNQVDFKSVISVDKTNSLFFLLLFFLHDQGNLNV